MVDAHVARRQRERRRARGVEQLSAGTRQRDELERATARRVVVGNVRLEEAERAVPPAGLDAEVARSGVADRRLRNRLPIRQGYAHIAMREAGRWRLCLAEWDRSVLVDESRSLGQPGSGRASSV